MPLSLDWLNDIPPNMKYSPTKNKEENIEDIIDFLYPTDNNTPVNLKIKNDIYAIANETINTTNTYLNKFKKLLKEYEIMQKHRDKQNRRQFFDMQTLDKQNIIQFASFILFEKDYERCMKVIMFNENAIGDYMVIREIVWQKYAFTLTSHEKCDFKTPKIYEYGKIKYNDNDVNEITELCDDKTFQTNLPKYNTLWYFTMDNIEYFDLEKAINNIPLLTENKQICDGVSAGINDLNQCLHENGLNHNDFNKKNVLLGFNQKNNLEIGLIDYGEADYNSKFRSVFDWNCNQFKMLKKKQPGPNVKDIKQSTSYNDATYDDEKIRKIIRKKVKKYAKTLRSTSAKKGGKTKTKRRRHR